MARNNLSEEEVLLSVLRGRFVASTQRAPYVLTVRPERESSTRPHVIANHVFCLFGHVLMCLETTRNVGSWQAEIGRLLDSASPYHLVLVLGCSATEAHCEKHELFEADSDT